MAPNSGVVDISSEETRNRWGGEELDFLASVVPSGEARLAFVADDVRFDGYSISNLEILYGRVYSQNNSGRFVSKYVCIFDDHGTNAASVPEVNVGSGYLLATLLLDCSQILPANSSALNPDCHFTRLQAIALLNTLQRRFGFGHP